MRKISSRYLGRSHRHIVHLLGTYCGKGRRLAVDRLHVDGFNVLRNYEFELFDANRAMELARAIKSNDEIACMTESIKACEAGISTMAAAMRPGMTEQALWAVLVHELMRLGGESMETRLLTSGNRTNPWFQECGENRIGVGDLVAFDTDAIGPFGYCCDISRTFHCGLGNPTSE